jgi:hypothetical protein
MKKIVISVVAVLMSASIYAQTTGTIGKNTYPILGKYTGKRTQGVYVIASGIDSLHNYASIVKDSVFVSQIGYKKGVAAEVKNYRIKHNHQNIKIEKPDNLVSSEWYVILAMQNNDASSNVYMEYSENNVYKNESKYLRMHIHFPNKENAEKFYNNLMSGTSTSAEPVTQVNTSSQSTQVKAEAQEVKIKIRNTGSDVAEMYYQKSPGSKDNYSFRVQKGQSAELKINVGCGLFYNVKGGRGPLILTATKAMDGTTQVVK